MQECIKSCQEYLIEGQINEEFVLDKVNTLMNCIRECNISVRWLLLHQQSCIAKSKEIFKESVNPEDILTLLLLSSKFENKLIDTFKCLIESKQERWDEDRIRCGERMQELADYFSGKALGKVTPDESITAWFTEMGNQVNSLEFSDSTFAGRKIQQLSKALEDIEQYHQIAGSIQVKTYLHETRADLKHMMRIANIRPILLTHISFITDISYSWQCLKQFQGMMQDKVKQNPQAALLLKTTFQKLSSILNTPLIRIIQAESPDMNSVSKYYSGELIKFVKQVLQIIPIQIFEILQDIIVLLTSKLRQFPPKFNKNDLKEYAQYEERQVMAKLTNQIAVFTESILSVESYQLGIAEVNPKELLDQGIRKELMRLLHKKLDAALLFQKATLDDFLKRLTKLAEDLGAFKVSVEYIQDFINAFGIKMFLEEFDRLINAYIDMEVHALQTNKLAIEELAYDEDIPLPDDKSRQFNVVNFMGRLLKEMLSLTEAKKTIYLESTLGFYESQKGDPVVTMKTLALLCRCIGITGLNGLDRLLGQKIQIEMKKVQKAIKGTQNEESKKNLGPLLSQLKMLTSFTEQYEKIYHSLKKQYSIIQSFIHSQLQAHAGADLGAHPADRADDPDAQADLAAAADEGQGGLQQAVPLAGELQ